MHIELRHLRTLRAIHAEGGLGRAASALHLTQSALSHQIKAMEAQAGVELFVRRTKPMRLTAAGQRLLRVAESVLPVIDAAEAEFRALERGSAGRLHAALECHACLDWLLPVMDRFRRQWPEVDLDIRTSLNLQALPALAQEVVDLVITSDPRPAEGVTYQPLFDYAPMLVVPAGHVLAGRPWAEPADLATETLLTYPVERERLDAFTLFLDPAGVEPAQTRAVEQTDVILMLVASGRGVTVLPDWVLRRAAHDPELALLPLTREGRLRRVHAALRERDLALPFMAHWLHLARNEAMRLMAGPG